jgi:Ca2+-binding RTX toxin-like protein
MEGNPGDDQLDGGPGNDVVYGNSGKDGLAGGDGDDRLNAVDGDTDRIDCGSGADVAFVDNGDVVQPGCEDVRR